MPYFPGGECLFWAPKARRISAEVILGGRMPMPLGKLHVGVHRDTILGGSAARPAIRILYSLSG